MLRYAYNGDPVESLERRAFRACAQSFANGQVLARNPAGLLTTSKGTRVPAVASCPPAASVYTARNRRRRSSRSLYRTLAEHRADFLPAVDPSQLHLPARNETERAGRRRC